MLSGITAYTVNDIDSAPKLDTIDEELWYADQCGCTSLKNRDFRVRVPQYPAGNQRHQKNDQIDYHS